MIFLIQFRLEDAKAVRDRVENRLQVELRDFPKVNAIFMLTDVVRWEMNVQLFSDLLISNNGIQGTVRNDNEKQIVDFHLCSQDLLYKDVFNIPRIAAGAFWYSLEHLFFLKYKKPLTYTLYGKPSKIIFDFASKVH